VIALGNKIVAEFLEEDSCDTLGRWMAHYVAGLIDAVESAGPRERPKARALCFEAILQFWKHRAEWPAGRRPFADFENVFETLAILNPNRQGAFYFSFEEMSRSIRKPICEGKQWLDKAGEIDQCARILISHCIEMTANPLLASAQGWIELAAKLQSSESTDIDAILALRCISGADADASDDNTPKVHTKTAIQLLEKKLATLEQFRDSASELESQWRKQLAELRRPTSNLGKPKRKRSNGA
jgi:hypothetical protein